MNESSSNEHDETIAGSLLGDPSSIPILVRAEVQLDRPYSTGLVIGSGGMGTVISAEDHVLERTIALKVLLSEKTNSQTARFRFEREARILARLEHPNIVPVHEAGMTKDGRPYYTMKRVQGRDLQSILAAVREGDQKTTERYQLNELLNIFRKICDGVSFAHHVGMVHRDLKPANIMIGNFGEVLVMDWGLAKILDEDLKEQLREAENAPRPETPPLTEASPDDTLHGQVMGTPHYMAPEQAAGDNDAIGIPADIYALGGILQAILTLHPPHSGGSCEEILDRIQSGERAPIPTEEYGKAPHCPDHRIPFALAAVVDKAMHIDPDHRYPDVDSLAQEIAAFRSGFATSAENASPLRHAFLFARRHRGITLALLVGSLVIITIYVFSFYQLRQERAYLRDRIDELRTEEYQSSDVAETED